MCKPYRGVCDGLYGCFRVDMIPRRWLILGARLVSLGGCFARESHPPRPETRTDGPSFSGEQNLCGTRGFPNVSVEYY